MAVWGWTRCEMYGYDFFVCEGYISTSGCGKKLLCVVKNGYGEYGLTWW